MQSKKVVVTGGSKGIGKSIILEFAKNGFDVITCSRFQKNLDDLNKEFEKSFPNQDLIAIASDLSNKAGRKVFADYISSIKVDVLINNAGVFIPGKIDEEEIGVLEQMIETNLYSAYDTTRAVLSQMKSNNSGSIFNICSTASTMAYENGGSYSISKFAMLGFSKVLREELKEFGLKVTSVLPGATRTSSWDGVEIPDERFMPPEDIAKTIWEVYKLSDRTVVEEIVLRPQLGDL